MVNLSTLSAGSNAYELSGFHQRSLPTSGVSLRLLSPHLTDSLVSGPNRYHKRDE